MYDCIIIARLYFTAAKRPADVKKPTKRVLYLLKDLEIDIDPHVSSLRRDILSAAIANRPSNRAEISSKVPSLRFSITATAVNEMEKLK